jgi:hypothetical protein
MFKLLSISLLATGLLALALTAPAQEARPDRDRDGVPDSEDQCPDQRGHRMNGGCPKDEPVKVNNSPGKENPPGKSSAPIDAAGFSAALVKVVNGAPDNFTSLKGTKLRENNGYVYLAAFQSTVIFPGCDSSIVSMMMTKTDHVSYFGEYSSKEEATKKFNELAALIKKSLGDKYYFMDGNYGEEMVKAGNLFLVSGEKIKEGMGEKLLELSTYYYKDKGIYRISLYCLGGAKKNYLYNVSSSKGDAEFSKNLLSIYNGIPNKFNTIRGEKIKVGLNDEYRISTPLPGASCLTQYNAFLREEGCKCTYDKGTESDVAGQYKKVLEKVKAALGKDFIYFEEKPLPGFYTQSIIFGEMRNGTIDKDNLVRVRNVKNTDGTFSVEVLIGRVMY